MENRNIEIISKNKDRLIKLMAKYIEVYEAIGADDKLIKGFAYMRRLLLLRKFDRLIDNDIVLEFCKTKRSKKLDELLSNKKVRSLMELGSVMGVGPVTANKLYVSHNITNIAGLVKAYNDKKIRLTSMQQLGLKYYSDLRERIPRQEVESIYNHIKPIFVPHKTIILGSYRRGAPTCGDIDILITGGKSGENVISKIGKKLVNLSKDRLIAIISQGSQKMSFLYRSGISGKVRHIDLFHARGKQYIPYLLYGTGSAEHNEMMRGIAKERGYKLNQLGLFYVGGRKDGSQRILRKEEDLYEILGVDYIEPTKR